MAASMRLRGMWRLGSGGRRRVGWWALPALLAAILAAPFPALAAPPANDKFANAATLVDGATINGTRSVKLELQRRR